VNCQDKISEKKPRLVVGIIVDQMRYDVIQRYWGRYENNGFKRLTGEGIVCRNVHYSTMVGRPCVSYATIVTGTNPAVHGIVSDDWYLRVSDKLVAATRDTTVTVLGGSYGAGVHSPRNLLVTTLGDELRFATRNASKVIAVSLDPVTAVLAGGHVPSASFWLDTETGNTISNSYYKRALPGWVNDFNRKRLADAYLDRTWEPLLEPASYTDSSSLMTDDYLFRGQKKFPYDLKKARKNYSLLVNVPFGINFLKDFAISAIVNEQLGKDDVPDLLLIGLSPPGNIARTFGLNSMEMEDTYLRLDKELKHFLDFVDGYLGKGNVLVFLVSGQGGTYNPLLMQAMGIPAGIFNANQAVALTRSYLKAKYGYDFIRHYNNLQFYLHENKIRESGHSFEAVLADMAGFLDDFTGVRSVIAWNDLLREGYAEGINRMLQNAFYPKRSGDLMLCLEPGWIERRGDAYNYISAGSSETHVPLLWYGWKTKRKVIYRFIDVTDIAATLSVILDVSFPSGCQGTPIIEVLE